ncbi:MAG: helical backbone metal receptor [Planctomycetota bacterium]
MAPNLTEILFELGLDEQIVGVTQYSTYPPETQNKINVGSFWQPDIEAVIACRPTLVLTLGFEQQSTLAGRLKNIGCRTLSVEIDSIEQLHEAIKLIGLETGRRQQAEKLVNRLIRTQNEISARPRPQTPVKVLWVIQREPLRVAGTKTFVNELIEIAGGVNAIGETIQAYPPISMETVLGAMPDIIIEPSHGSETYEKQLAGKNDFYKRFSIIPAVRNNQVHIVDGDLVSRLSPRLDEGMSLVADCIGGINAQ